jgi:hypothetical protein
LIDNVSTLTITGGEPTLAMDSLEHLRHCIIYENCDVGSFYMVTNGKAINIERTAEWINNMHNCCSDNEISGVGFSFDDFHTQTFNWGQLEKRNNNYEKLQNIIEFEYGMQSYGEHFIIKHSDKSWNQREMIAQGRYENYGSRELENKYFEIDNYDDTMQVSDASLYLSATGMLVVGGNWSYKNIDNRKDIQIGHIDDMNCTDDLIEAIKRYNQSVKDADDARVAECRENKKLQLV